MSILDKPTTRYITGYETYNTNPGHNDITYEQSRFNQFFNPGTGEKMGPTTEELILGAYILHCLVQSGYTPKRFVLSSTLPHRQWYDISPPDVKIDIYIYEG